MIVRTAALCAVSLFAFSCARELPPVDPQLASEIAAIKAIDNHAHPVLATAGDREFDALPVDHMEPSTDAVAMRPDWPAAKTATQALFGSTSKAEMIRQKGDAYPSWVLDQAGIEIMFANRVALGPSIQPPRFRWVPYIDALMFPLDNSGIAGRNPDRKAFFALEDKLRSRYLGDSALPVTLSDYTSRIVTPILEQHRKGGAVAEKFEAAYLRDLAFAPADVAQASAIYRKYAGKGVPVDGDYKILQDYLFRYIAAECGRLGMAVHIHTMAGAGGYFDVAGANPLNLESLFDNPALRQTRFVMVHGGWPFVREAGALLNKPNAYLDLSAQVQILPPAVIAGWLREWLALYPEKVLFGTDAYPYSEQAGWEETTWLGARGGREALGRALTVMMRDGEITHQRAVELARMVLRENARTLYGL